jgi:hypothetical protein
MLYTRLQGDFEAVGMLDSWSNFQPE